ncbi:hypothetical protein WMF38_07510 [Sorangium sp. So ce118]
MDIPKESNVVLWKYVRGSCIDPSSRSYDATALSDAVVRVIEQVGDDRLPDHVVTAVNDGLFTLDEGALLIGVASYSTDDEGSRILNALDEWLDEGMDETRIALALAQDTFPFRSRARRATVLAGIATRFPAFADRCRYLIENSPD